MCAPNGRSPELNPVENIWQFTRDNWLSNRVFQSYDEVVDHCCFAWNRLVDQPWTIVHRPAQLGTSVLISGTWYKGGEHTRCETPLGSVRWSDFAAHRRQLAIFG